MIFKAEVAGNRKAQFFSAPASETKSTIKQPELSNLEAYSDANIHQLLLIPCVILDFLCLHPFWDGIRRMIRRLSLLLLYEKGYDVGKYVSFEGRVNNHKKFCCEAL